MRPLQLVDGWIKAITDGTGSGIDADTVDGLHATDLLAIENDFQNGELCVWQWYTAPVVITVETEEFIADRILNWCSTGASLTITREDFAEGQTVVPGNPKYFHGGVWITGSGQTRRYFMLLGLKMLSVTPDRR